MDHKVGEAVKRKYAGVKTSTLKNIPVTVRLLIYLDIGLDWVHRIER